MRIDSSNGEDETWMLEAGSIYMLARTGITRNRVRIWLFRPTEFFMIRAWTTKSHRWI